MQQAPTASPPRSLYLFPPSSQLSILSTSSRFTQPTRRPIPPNSPVPRRQHSRRPGSSRNARLRTRHSHPHILQKCRPSTTILPSSIGPVPLLHLTDLRADGAVLGEGLEGSLGRVGGGGVGARGGFGEGEGCVGWGGFGGFVVVVKAGEEVGHCRGWNGKSWERVVVMR